MRKKNTIPSEFNDILGSIYNNAEEGSSITNVDDEMADQLPPLEEEQDDVPPVNTEDKKDNENDTIEHSVKDDDSQIPQDVLDKINNTDKSDVSNTEEDENEVTNEALMEAQNVGLLFDAIGESFGWNMSDIDEKDRPLTIDDLTGYIKETVKQNSIPQYADNRVEELDNFIKNGGKFEDFYSIQKENLSLDNIDIEDEANQKQIVKELLKYQGYTDEQISKRISRYEDADMLLEESEDALERLKTIRKREEEEALKQQEEIARQQEEQSKAFYNAVTKDINELSDIRGIAIPKEDRKALYDYIFKVDQNGMSQYQKDFNKNLSKNLIESAYFTMKADTLISNAKKGGETTATEKLRKLLRHSYKDHSTYNVDQDKQKSVLDLASGLF